MVCRYAVLPPPPPGLITPPNESCTKVLYTRAVGKMHHFVITCFVIKIHVYIGTYKSLLNTITIVLVQKTFECILVGNEGPALHAEAPSSRISTEAVGLLQVKTGYRC